jgi:glucosamine kinase
VSSATLIIDGGGSNTGVAVVRSGDILARATLPSFKPESFLPRTDELCRALGSWLETADPAPIQPQFVLIGMSGIWADQEKQSYMNDFTDAWMTYISDEVPRTAVLSDVELVHFAALGNRSGIVLIAGTGSIAVARLEDGSTLRSGGWGPKIGDEGSGHWLGCEALRAVARMLDGRGESTLLIRPVAAFLRRDPSSLDSLSAALRKMDVARCAMLAPSVLTYAEEGDEVAMEIRDRAVVELSSLVTSLVESREQKVEVIFHGSLFKNVEFRTSVEESISASLALASTSTMDDLLACAAQAIDSST